MHENRTCNDCKNCDFCYQNQGVCMFFEPTENTESTIDAFAEYAEVQNALNK